MFMHYSDREHCCEGVFDLERQVRIGCRTTPHPVRDRGAFSRLKLGRFYFPGVEHDEV